MDPLTGNDVADDCDDFLMYRKIHPALTSFEAFREAFNGFGVDHDTYYTFRNYLSIGMYPPRQKVNFNLLCIAMHMNLRSLISFCERAIFLNMAPENTYASLFKADLLGAKLLKSAILKYLVQNRDYFTRHFGWGPLEQHPRLLNEYKKELSDPNFDQNYQWYLNALRNNKDPGCIPGSIKTFISQGLDKSDVDIRKSGEETFKKPLPFEVMRKKQKTSRAADVLHRSEKMHLMTPGCGSSQNALSLVPTSTAPYHLPSTPYGAASSTSGNHHTLVEPTPAVHMTSHSVYNEVSRSIALNPKTTHNLSVASVSDSFKPPKIFFNEFQELIEPTFVESQFPTVLTASHATLPIMNPLSEIPKRSLPPYAFMVGRLSKSRLPHFCDISPQLQAAMNDHKYMASVGESRWHPYGRQENCRCYRSQISLNSNYGRYNQSLSSSIMASQHQQPSSNVQMMQLYESAQIMNIPKEELPESHQHLSHSPHLFNRIDLPADNSSHEFHIPDDAAIIRSDVEGCDVEIGIPSLSEDDTLHIYFDDPTDHVGMTSNSRPNDLEYIQPSFTVTPTNASHAVVESSSQRLFIEALEHLQFTVTPDSDTQEGTDSEVSSSR